MSIAISGVGSFAIFLYLSYFLQRSLGFSATAAGFAFLPFAAALIVGAGISGSALLPRFGPRPIIPAGCLSSAASLLLLTRIDVDTEYVTGVLPAVILAGFGTGLIFGSAQNVATSGVASSHSGVASALVNTMQQVGGAIGLALFTYVSATATDRYLFDNADQTTRQTQALAALSSYHTVFWVAIGIFVVGAGITAATFRSGTIELNEDAAPAH